MLRYKLYANLALEMCDRLERTGVANIDDETTWDATLMRFQVLGENVKKIPSKFKKRFPEIKWRNFEWFRNQISHDYETIFKEVIIGLIKKDLSNLRNALLKIKMELKDEK